MHAPLCFDPLAPIPFLETARNLAAASREYTQIANAVFRGTSEGRKCRER